MSSGTDFTPRVLRGFTVVEMMITLLVLAILIVLGAPAFTDLIKDNRMLSDVYAMRAALNDARSEALTRRTFVTVCRSDNGLNCSGAGENDWKKGYIAFVDVNGDGNVDDPNDPAGDDLFFSKVTDSNTLEVFRYSNGTATDPVANRVRFDSRGFASNFEGTFTLCDDRGAGAARGVIVTPQGVVRAAVEDPNDPGIVRDLNGDELDCD